MKCGGLRLASEAVQLGQQSMVVGQQSRRRQALDVEEVLDVAAGEEAVRAAKVGYLGRCGDASA